MPADPLVLAFDTAAAHCAAALVQGASVRARAAEPMARGQAERLMPLLGELLAGAGAGWGDVGLVAVGTGPGNFTGLRIGVAAARGLALGRGIPAIGVSLFESLAHGHRGPALVTLDDRRGGLFARMLRDGLPAGPAIETAAGRLAPDLGPLPAGTLCLGHAAPEVAAELGLRAGNDAALPDAVAIAQVAALRHLRGEAPRPAPLYIRRADAAPPGEAPAVILDDA
ncbi:tRNA (adenosine(37)-N6)-threonylcarbamoyltransferase complex dimerization subunit type 1 TsaB [Amaricoccus solimangrovi]|uniref:tRNA (Adenosine(37)-N6)-threonylcarbamoyltransferase complex dimerization subunit type 1 TsaB n=1 Tax=Amaricoccus solimangrovi TaxID=2589815 RepID=A0A501WJ65_9RHOB|nr:tRNA (adenosine(37)-N6)-threonylcarbamoyltransferase complex dimerization subunit type 1 TsaB [Amaricoccus solimangrovi]TPE49923.1 tRNA (adenosine(37)-N6)-threonylcarbamoyltransferase complex dimerization subunit type 1 TsaB [Amaricoccus solimangrovi]